MSGQEIREALAYQAGISDFTEHKSFGFRDLRYGMSPKHYRRGWDVAEQGYRDLEQSRRTS